MKIRTHLTLVFPCIIFAIECMSILCVNIIFILLLIDSLLTPIVESTYLFSCVQPYTSML